MEKNVNGHTMIWIAIGVLGTLLSRQIILKINEESEYERRSIELRKVETEGFNAGFDAGYNHGVDDGRIYRNRTQSEE